MDTINLRRDGLVLLILAVMLVMLASALTGAYRVFGYALVALVGALAVAGFARRDDPVTWIPPIVATTVLLVAFMGMFANEATEVRDATDPVFGFQAGTAFLIYGVWIPAFFTMAVSFALIFNRLSGENPAPTRKRESR